MAVLATAGIVGAGLAVADGTETLGPPAGVTLASGTGVAVAGVGLGGHTGVPNQVGNFTVSVPAGATVQQVLLYWEGHFHEGTTPDDTVTLNGNPVTGSQIGGPTLFFADVYATGFRADVTGLGLVGAGNTALTVSGLDNSFANDGAGVVVIYDEGTTPATIDVRDGVDLAFAGFAPPLDTTVPQTFTFPAAPAERTASLGVMAASVEPNRPNAIVVTTGGVTTTLTNPLFSEQGADFDAKSIPVTIPAGATSLTVQAQSVGDGSGALPASLSWIVGSLSVPNPPPGAGAGTPGYWRNHPEAWPVDSLVLGGVTYTKDAAIAILATPTSRDMTYVLASQLIATKLNLLIGTDPSCITGTVAAADAWLATYPIGSGVRAGSDAWRVGEPLKTTLDAYNNGLLCAPSRD
ncbi:MAG: hypothetical protein ACLGIO_09845 [Acidimicrobiia bacterium]